MSDTGTCKRTGTATKLTIYMFRHKLIELIKSGEGCKSIMFFESSLNSFEEIPILEVRIPQRNQNKK